MKNKKRAAYIDLAFKKVTRSNDFVKNVLSKQYELTELWVEDNDKPNRIIDYLNCSVFDTLFFFQWLPPAKYLKKLKCKKLVWFPMYDTEANKSYLSYVPYLNTKIKVVSFSKQLFEIMKKAGLQCYYYQFYLYPKKNKGVFDKLNIFFWMRTADVSWQTVKTLIGRNKIHRIIIKSTPDPNQKIVLPTKKEMDIYHIKIVSKWLNKQNYKNLLNSCNIFIAPRKFEGIGMSFIEALANGMCVIAPNNPTMNEYITHEKSGLLYNLDKPKELNLKHLRYICKNTIRSSIEGYRQWNKIKNRILINLEEPSITPNHMKLIYLKLLSFIYAACSKITSGSISLVPPNFKFRARKFISM